MQRASAVVHTADRLTPVQFSLLCGRSHNALRTLAEAGTRARAVIEQITTYNAGLNHTARLKKYVAMKSSPQAFFRWTAHLFWNDMGTAALLSPFGSSATLTFLQGASQVDGQDLSHCDRSATGDYQLDLWRLATSLLLLAREQGGFGAKDEETIVDAYTDGYLFALTSSAHSCSRHTRMSSVDSHQGLLEDCPADEAYDSRKSLLDRYDATALRPLSRITRIAMQWGAVLATAHARIDDDYLAALIPHRFSDRVLGQIGNWSRHFRASVRQVAMAEADQAKTDYQTFVAWFAAHPNS